jgi:hypothetical protein
MATGSVFDCSGSEYRGLQLVKVKRTGVNGAYAELSSAVKVKKCGVVHASVKKKTMRKLLVTSVTNI